MKAVWTIARRELRSLFDHPTGYILLIVFLAITEFLFFRQAYLLQSASLRPMLDLLPWVYLFFVPAVTMRALAEDARTGTIEIVLAQPITEAQLLIGKYLGQVLFIWIALLCTVPVTFGLAFGADLQVGVIVAQYVGAALLGAGMAGVGVWGSSASRNQITAFILSTFVLFLLILIGLDPLLVGLPASLGGYAATLGVLSHFSSIARGVIDLRDVVYFLTLAAVFLFFAYYGLMARKLAPQGETVKRLRLGVMLMTAAAIVLNLFGRHIGGRLDLTPGRTYTLSDATKDILDGLPDIVTLKFYASQEVPPEFALLKRDVEDLLADYRSSGKGKVRVVRLDPGKDSTAKQEAGQLGIPAVQFNVMGRSELQIKEGYLGIAVSFANANEVIPTVNRTNDLEYQLSTFIRQLTRTTKPVLAFVSSERDRQLGRRWEGLLTELRKNYEVKDVTAADSVEPVATTRVLILAGTPDSLPQRTLDRINRYLAEGGSALVFSSGMTMSPQGDWAQPLPINWNPVLRPFGIQINADLVYDIASNQPVSLPSQFGQMYVPYPLWVRGPSTKMSVVNQGMDGAFLPWVSSIDTTGAARGTVTPLLISSRGAGVEGLRVLMNPMRNWPRDSLRTRLLAVQVNPLADTAASNGAAGPKGRLVVVGSTDWARDGYRAPENLNLLMNAVDWLAQDVALISIRSKDRTPPKLLFESATLQDTVKYLNLIGVPLLLVGLASVRLVARKRKQRQPFVPFGRGVVGSEGREVGTV